MKLTRGKEEGGFSLLPHDIDGHLLHGVAGPKATMLYLGIPCQVHYPRRWVMWSRGSGVLDRDIWKQAEYFIHVHLVLCASAGDALRLFSSSARRSLAATSVDHGIQFSRPGSEVANA